jgi:hypothetical protein
MIAEATGSIFGTIVSGYESVVQTFGSPVVLLAISVTLIALATVELCIRRCRKPAEVE